MILGYIKGFLVLFLLVKVLLYFVPKRGFEKYIAFFAGVVLVIGLLYPILEITGQEKSILEKMDYKQWEEQLFEVSVKAQELEQTGKRMVEEQYQAIIEETRWEDIEKEVEKEETQKESVQEEESSKTESSKTESSKIESSETEGNGRKSNRIKSNRIKRIEIQTIKIEGK